MKHLGDITQIDGRGINRFFMAVTKYRFGG